MTTITINEYKLCNNKIKSFIGVMLKKKFVPHVFFGKNKLANNNKFSIHTFFCKTIDLVVLDKDNKVILIWDMLPKNQTFKFEGNKFIEFQSGIYPLEIDKGDIIEFETKELLS